MRFVLFTNAQLATCRDGYSCRDASFDRHLCIVSQIAYQFRLCSVRLILLNPLLSSQLRKRRLPGIDPTVEARDMDDWMIVDCGNVVVNVFDAGASSDLLYTWTN